MSRVQLRETLERDGEVDYRMLRDLARHLGQGEAFTASPDDILRDNPARGFYEALGMEPSAERPYHIQEDAMSRLAGEG